MAMWLHEYQVIGNGNFPTDMLRYDSSYPGSQESVSQMVLADSRDYCNAYMDEHKSQPVFVVNLKHRDDTKNWQPTIDRWRSFGWQVRPQTIKANKI